MDSKMTARAMPAPWRRGIEILVTHEYGEKLAVGSLVMEEIDPHMRQQPTVVLEMEDAQTLMDDLWNAGLRPTEGTGSAGSLRATEKHLEDMRTIAFKKLGIDDDR